MYDGYSYIGIFIFKKGIGEDVCQCSFEHNHTLVFYVSHLHGPIKQGRSVKIK